MAKFDNLSDRFLSKIQKTMYGCHYWTSTRSSSGYGNFWFMGGQVLAHRMAYEMLIGPIPEGLLVCHTCDVKHCVNPDHLFLGTQSDNQADMTAKGRGRVGSINGRAILDVNGAADIRHRFKLGVQQKYLAREYGVAQQTISRVVRMETW